MKGMRPEKAKRVEVNPAQAGLSGLGQAFAGLSLGPLPEGPAEPPPAAKAVEKTTGKPVKKGRVILRKETAHRGGKVVIVIHDFPASMSEEELERIAKALRHGIGTGGTVRERTIEMQGDQAAKIRAWLEREGWTVAGV